ncbi:MAG: CDP-archaeol synthase [archaeon]
MVSAALLQTLWISLWFVLPAWVANISFTMLGAVTRTRKIKDVPLDFRQKFFDGKRLFGDHVTLYGMLLGATVGIIVGLLQGRVLAGFLLGFGAFWGDTLGSFIKRRIGFKEGTFFPILDHVDYLIVAIPLVSIAEPLDVTLVVTSFILTLIFHPLACIVGYKLKLKREPW